MKLRRRTLVHLGGVRFGVTGPVRYTMTARDGVDLMAKIRPHTVIPIHYEGWTHFQQNREVIQQEFDKAPAEFRDAVRWAPIGGALDVIA
jgi:L-ascorbate metabolism protein UlaG (beta-lactamase superfamily)